MHNLIYMSQQYRPAYNEKYNNHKAWNAVSFIYISDQAVYCVQISFKD